MPANFASRRLAVLLRGTASGGGAVVMPIIPTAPMYTDDFTYTDGYRLVAGDPNANAGQVATNPGNLGWTAISQAGATSNEKYNPIVVSGAIVYRSTNNVGDFATVNGVTNAGRYLLSPVDVGSTNQFIQFKAAALTSLGIDALATDEVNRLRFDVTGGNFVLTRFLNTTKTTAASLANLSTVRMQGGVTSIKSPAVGDVFTVRVYAGTAYLSRNNAPIGAATGYDVSAVTGTRVGTATFNASFRSIDNMRAGVLTGKIFLADQIKTYPRVPGFGGYAAGAATVPISGTYVGTAPTGLQWALYDPENGALVKDYAWVPTPTIGSGNWSANIVVPCGANGAKPYRLAVRAGNDTWNEAFGYVPFYVSVPVLFVGQSENIQLFFTNTATGFTPDHPGGLYYNPGYPSATPVSPGVTTSWENSTVETTNADCAIGFFTLALSNALGLPIYVVLNAIAAHGAAALDPAQINSDGTWQRAHLAGSGGRFELGVLLQGENEVNAADGGAGSAAWSGQWTGSNLPHYHALNSNGATAVPWLVCITGKYLGSTQSDNANILRRAQETLGATAGYTLAAHSVGIALDDSVHYSRNGVRGAAEFSRRLGLSAVKLLTGTGYDGLGPLASLSATRSGAVVTIPVNLNGAASINTTDASGTGMTGWEFSTSSTFGSLLTVSSSAISSGNLVFTLSANPGVPVYYRFFTGYAPADTNVVVGTYADATTIEMKPVANPGVTST